MQRTSRAVIDTPFGPLSAWWHDDGTLRVEWGERTVARGATARGATRDSAGSDHPLPARLAARLARAARGEAVDFDDIPTPPGTPFKRRCWNSARRIPRGETITYGELAKRAGSPGAARAAGQAMRTNPLPLIVPCHRVVATNGLGGYAGTADSRDERCRRKQGLLARERAAAR